MRVFSGDGSGLGRWNIRELLRARAAQQCMGSAVEVAVNASPIETAEKPVKATTRKRAK